MHLRNVLILLVLSVVAESCDEETQYEKDNKCCKKCGPGTRMKKAYSTCDDPSCEPCAEGEYQNAYNIDPKCKLQPSCDPNLNLQALKQSKTERSPCVCKAEHHCSNTDCVSCVRNTVCKAGEKISKAATQMEDTVCEQCPLGTFSDHESATTCTPWTECTSETDPGSLTSDRICDPQNTLAIGISVVVLLLLLALGIVVIVFFMLKRGKTGSISFVQQTCPFWCKRNTHQPAENNVHVEIEQPVQPPNQPVQPPNQPQEDTEDLLKLDHTPGVSENGMPVSQDHSKSSLLSEKETEPESFSVHF